MKVYFEIDESDFEDQMVRVLRDDYLELELSYEEEQAFLKVMQFYSTAEDHEKWYENTH